ncbi:MAG TPA: DUF21 domain-containing protein, partial [Verrucomicrobiota bacterium]|nr:DUF21 domain-containing protein [Verrucomicrobiota bacterium]
MTAGLNATALAGILRSVNLLLPWIFAPLLVLATASFFFAAAETAFFSLGSWRIRHVAERDPERGRLVAELMAHPDDLLATLVLGNTVANFFLVAVGLVIPFDAEWQRVAVLVCLLLVLLLGCEVTPKALAVRSPEAWALRLARPLSWLVPASQPVRRMSQGFVQTVLRPLVRRAIPLPTGVSDEEYTDL